MPRARDMNAVRCPTIARRDARGGQRRRDRVVLADDHQCRHGHRRQARRRVGSVAQGVERRDDRSGAGEAMFARASSITAGCPSRVAVLKSFGRSASAAALLRRP